MEYEERLSMLEETIERKEEIISRLQDKITEIKGELFLLEIEKEDLVENGDPDVTSSGLSYIRSPEGKDILE